jgi:hypothetical protein
LYSLPAGLGRRRPRQACTLLVDFRCRIEQFSCCMISVREQLEEGFAKAELGLGAEVSQRTRAKERKLRVDFTREARRLGGGASGSDHGRWVGEKR